eukprot:g4653.t1
MGSARSPRGGASPSGRASPGRRGGKRVSRAFVVPAVRTRFAIVDLAGAESAANVRLRRGSVVSGRWDAKELKAAGPARIDELRAVERSLSNLGRVIDLVMRRNQAALSLQQAEEAAHAAEAARGAGDADADARVAEAAAGVAAAAALGRLASGEQVPYRDSKLTHLLKPVFEGLTRTTVLLTVSPMQRNAQTTRYTLRFGHALARLTLARRRSMQEQVAATQAQVIAQAGARPLAVVPERLPAADTGAEPQEGGETLDGVQGGDGVEDNAAGADEGGADGGADADMAARGAASDSGGANTVAFAPLAEEVTADDDTWDQLFEAEQKKKQDEEVRQQQRIDTHRQAAETRRMAQEESAQREVEHEVEAAETAGIRRTARSMRAWWDESLLAPPTPFEAAGMHPGRSAAKNAREFLGLPATAARALNKQLGVQSVRDLVHWWQWCRRQPSRVAVNDHGWRAAAECESTNEGANEDRGEGDGGGGGVDKDEGGDANDAGGIERTSESGGSANAVAKARAAAAAVDAECAGKGSTSPNSRKQRRTKSSPGGKRRRRRRSISIGQIVPVGGVPGSSMNAVGDSAPIDGTYVPDPIDARWRERAIEHFLRVHVFFGDGGGVAALLATVHQLATPGVGDALDAWHRAMTLRRKNAGVAEAKFRREFEARREAEAQAKLEAEAAAKAEAAKALEQAKMAAELRAVEAELRSVPDAGVLVRKTYSDQCYQCGVEGGARVRTALCRVYHGGVSTAEQASEEDQEEGVLDLTGYAMGDSGSAALARTLGALGSSPELHQLASDARKTKLQAAMRARGVTHLILSSSAIGAGIRQAEMHSGAGASADALRPGAAVTATESAEDAKQAAADAESAATPTVRARPARYAATPGLVAGAMVAAPASDEREGGALGFDSMPGKLQFSVLSASFDALVLLDLSDNAMGTEAASVVLDALETNRALRVLSLAGNEIEDNVRVDALARNASLTSLSLADNRLCDGAAQRLGTALLKRREAESYAVAARQVAVAIIREAHAAEAALAISVGSAGDASASSSGNDSPSPSRSKSKHRRHKTTDKGKRTGSSKHRRTHSSRSTRTGADKGNDEDKKLRRVNTDSSDMVTASKGGAAQEAARAEAAADVQRKVDEATEVLQSRMDSLIELRSIEANRDLQPKPQRAVMLIVAAASMLVGVEPQASYLLGRRRSSADQLQRRRSSTEDNLRVEATEGGSAAVEVSKSSLKHATTVRSLTVDKANAGAGELKRRDSAHSVAGEQDEAHMPGHDHKQHVLHREVPRYYKEAKQSLLKSPEEFMSRIKAFDPASVPAERMENAMILSHSPTFDADTVLEASKLAAALCHWVEAAMGLASFNLAREAEDKALLEKARQKKLARERERPKSPEQMALLKALTKDEHRLSMRGSRRDTKKKLKDGDAKGAEEKEKETKTGYAPAKLAKAVHAEAELADVQPPDVALTGALQKSLATIAAIGVSKAPQQADSGTKVRYDPQHPDGTYELHLSRPMEAAVAELLRERAIATHSTWLSASLHTTRVVRGAVMDHVMNLTFGTGDFELPTNGVLSFTFESFGLPKRIAPVRPFTRDQPLLLPPQVSEKEKAAPAAGSGAAHAKRRKTAVRRNSISARKKAAAVQSRAAAMHAGTSFVKIAGDMANTQVASGALSQGAAALAVRFAWPEEDAVADGGGGSNDAAATAAILQKHGSAAVGRL